jgi:hypothetical protein
MPKLPDDLEGDLNSSGTRFGMQAAIAVPVPEEEWGVYEAKPEEALREFVGDWLLEEQDELGRGNPVNGAAGHGADAWIPVIEFVAINAASGVVTAAAGMAFRRVWRRMMDARRGRRVPALYVSRGGAATLAAAEAAERYDEAGSLEIEAVEEPSSIAGREVWTMSYVTLEPWIVLLRNREERIRLHRRRSP